MYNSKNFPQLTTTKLRRILLFFKLFGFLPYSESSSANTCLILFSLLKLCSLLLTFKTNLKDTHFSFYLTEMVKQIVYYGLVFGYVIFTLESFFYRKVLHSFYTKYDTLERNYLPGSHSKRRFFDVIFKISISLLHIIFITGQVLGDGPLVGAHGTLIVIFSCNVVVRCAQFVIHVEMVYIKLVDLYEQLVFLKENQLIFKLYNKSQQHSLETKLENCRESYGKIYELVLDVNHCFGWSMLSIIVQLFYTLTSDAYYTCLVLLGGFGGTVLRGAINITPHIITMIVITFTIQKCSKMVQKIINILHTFTKTNENRMVIHGFALQIFQCPVLFTANDLFQINVSLLGTMISSIVTYLVILLSFSKPSMDD